jgi:hypothetical protein
MDSICNLPVFTGNPGNGFWAEIGVEYFYRDNSVLFHIFNLLLFQD